MNFIAEHLKTQKQSPEVELILDIVRVQLPQVKLHRLCRPDRVVVETRVNEKLEEQCQNIVDHIK